MISKDRLQKALTYLAETDEEAAQKKALFNGLEHQLKTIYGQCYLKTQGTVEERKSKAYIDPDYKAHLQKMEQAQLDYEILRNKRLTESLIVEVWRSETSARKAGMIV